MPTFTSFDEFFRYYVSQHSKPATRWVHFGATHAGAAVALAALIRRAPLLLLAVPAVIYGPAFASHWLIEKNSPVTLRGHQLWAVRGDLKMITTMWRGRDAELSRLAAEELEQSVEGVGIRIHVTDERAAAVS